MWRHHAALAIEARALCALVPRAGWRRIRRQLLSLIPAPAHSSASDKGLDDQVAAGVGEAVGWGGGSVTSTTNHNLLGVTAARCASQLPRPVGNTCLCLGALLGSAGLHRVGLRPAAQAEQLRIADGEVQTSVVLPALPLAAARTEGHCKAGRGHGGRDQRGAGPWGLTATVAAAATDAAPSSTWGCCRLQRSTGAGTVLNCFSRWNMHRMLA